MNAEWIRSTTARRILLHWADTRPAWLWSQDGETLLWRNDAARFFQGKVKKSGLRLAPETAPIKGQVARLIRLGAVGRSSLSRIRFLAGDRPVSTTCTCTPLAMADDDLALLIVAVDPIEAELLEAVGAERQDDHSERLFPPGADYLLIDEDSQIGGGSPHAMEQYAPVIESEGLPELPAEGSGLVDLAGKKLLLTRYKASPYDAVLLLLEPLDARIVGIRAAEGIEATRPAADAVAMPLPDEPLLPLGLPPLPPRPEASAPGPDEQWTEPLLPPPEESQHALSSLFDRLANDDGLYSPLSAADESFDGPPARLPAVVLADRSNLESYDPSPPSAAPDNPSVAEDFAGLGDSAGSAEALAAAGHHEDAEVVEPRLLSMEAGTLEGAEPRLESSREVAGQSRYETAWQVTGRSFEPLRLEHSGDRLMTTRSGPGGAAGAPPSQIAGPEQAESGTVDPEAVDLEVVERVSRYNFDELTRILTDRIGSDPLELPPAQSAQRPAKSNPEGALVSVAGETFILNRLPLGILVFRDQQVLFANRAILEFTGQQRIEDLRSAGLGAIFPAEDAAAAESVSHLLRRDGSLLPVNARLQSINWHGTPALMLCASPYENRNGHEGAVRSFAELLAESRDEGYITADRSGVVTLVSLQGRILLGESEATLLGQPLAALVDPLAISDLRAFLERPARFAETARPALTLRAIGQHTEIQLFAEGQAGLVTGYFGFISRTRDNVPAKAGKAVPARQTDAEPGMLTRLSRGVRGPLNTIIGFADLIGGSASGSIPHQRHVEYARDIQTAGQEIATLIDELDDYWRLRSGNYTSSGEELELGALLESCVLRVRGHASAERVLVRSGISERLPRIVADAGSLSQAILNLLASAIEQTPSGGSVILSAQQEDDGSVIVNIRDNGAKRNDPGERFVVFRDGVGRSGEQLMSAPSSVGLALTRSLLAVSALSLSVDPTAGTGTLFSFVIPVDMVRS